MPSDLTDAEQAELYFRRGLCLLLGVPITDARVIELAAALDTLAPALVDAVQPGRYCDLVTKVIDGRVQGVQVTWQVRQLYPRRAG
jgi:hypothetical protein